MSESIKPTPGPCWVWIVEDDDDTSYMTVFERLDTQGRHEGVPICRLQSEHAAGLIAEAGTLFHETGLSPRQLAERNAELLEALRALRLAREQDKYRSWEKGAPDFNKAEALADAALAKCQPKEATP